MKPTDFIKGKVTYDKEGQYFWIHNKNTIQMLAELRGWGAIQNLFVKNGKIDSKTAAIFQDEIGEWIADAINEKLKREVSG